MLDRAKDKRYDLSIIFMVLKKEIELIKADWFIFFICFFISRYSIIDKIFPFAIIILCTYCYINGPSFTLLAISLLSITTVRFDFTYTVMLIAIYLFFYNFKNEAKKPIVIISAYAAAVLFSSKTSILIVEGFKLKGLALNFFESAFVFSGIILLTEGTRLIGHIKKSSIKEYLHRPKVKIHKNKAEAETEAASTAAEKFSSVQTKLQKRKKEYIQEKKLLNIFTEKAKLKIKEQLLWENINVKYFEVISGTGDSVFMSVTVKTDKSPEKTEEAIIFTVRNLCGVKLKCTEKITATPNYYVLKFKNIKKVKIKTYVASATKNGSPMSGDSYAYSGRSDKYYAVLCDGIGSGEEAFAESNGAVGMLSRFLYTDFTEEQILKTLNSLLMLKLDDERYVTFDLQIIDYGSREVRLYKAGTPPTFIISGGTIEKIEGKSLPMGILENFEYNTFKRVIRKGDIIIMISDGIIDSVNLDDKKSLEKFLEIIINKDPQTMANLILSYAIRGQKNIIDDMTVLVTKVGE